MRGTRITIREIAEQAGVSKATVSFAFNAPWKISPETRDRVLAVAQTLDYIPDPVARTLTTKRIGTIGLLLPQAIQDVFLNPYLIEVLQGIGSVCHAEDLSLTILPPVKGLLSHTVRTALVDAIVTIGIGADAEILNLMRKRHLPFVTIDGVGGAGALNVGIDDEGAGYALMRHVLDFGHRRIDIISLRNVHELLMGLDSDGASRFRILDLRMRGINRALAERNLRSGTDQVRVFPCDAATEAAERLSLPLLAAPDRPSAFVCLSDAAALGVYAACGRLGLVIPRDLSVVGFDGIALGSLMAPPLTTLRQPGFEKGRAAAALVLASLREQPCRDQFLASELYVGGSCSTPG